MNTQEIIARLRENEPALRARGDNRPDSDIDIMIEIAPDAAISLFDYVAITQYLADLFPIPVDVANRNQLKPLVRPNVERHAVHAF